MKLQGGDRAVVDIAKLRDYCLDPGHPRGRFKARVFASALRLTQSFSATNFFVQPEMVMQRSLAVMNMANATRSILI